VAAAQAFREHVAALAAIGLALCAGCSRKPENGTAAATEIPPRIWERFSGERALDEVARQVAIGPRPSGSKAIEQAREHITTTLRAHGWEVERQEFEAAPVPTADSIRFVNLIARFAAAADQPARRDTQLAIVGSHFDTKRMDGVHFVGANDGASSTGALLELARVLASAPAFAERIELSFFDGEEAVDQYGPAESGPDGLVGSRHYAQSLRESGRASQFRFAIVWDMIGDRDLTVTLPRDSPAALAGGIFAASEALGVRQKFGYYNGPMLDDHVPIAIIARIPAIDIIDFDYPPWHTAADTMDKVSPASLETIGRVTLWLLARELAK
jgi:hypothetical protein